MSPSGTPPDPHPLGRAVQQALPDGNEGLLRSAASSEALLRQVVASSADCIKVLDLTGTLLAINEQARCVLEVDDPSTLLNTCWTDWWADPEHGMALRAVAEANEGRVGRFEGFAKTAKGTPKWWEVVVLPVVGPTGRPEQLLSVSRDVTAQRRAAERLAEDGRERERMLLTLTVERSNLAGIIERAPTLICVLRGPEHIHERANERYYDLIGRRDVIGEPIRAALAGIAGQRFIERLDEVYRTGEPFIRDGVEFVPTGGGPGAERRFVNFVLQAVRGEDGAVSGVFVHGVDVTDRLLDERRLRQSEARYRALVTASSDIAYRMSADWSVMSPLDGRNLVPTAAEPVGGWAWLHQNVPADEHPRVRVAISKAIAAKTLFELEHRVRRPDGSTGWTFSRAVPILDDAGHVVEWFGAASDITERKRAEMALTESTTLLAAISEATGDVIFAKDRQGRMRYANPATLGLIGKPFDQVQGRTDAEFLDDPDAARTVMANDQRVMDGGVPVDVEEVVPLPDGTRRVWLSRKMPDRDAAGHVVGLLGVSRDVTEQKAAEQERERLLLALATERSNLAAIVERAPAFMCTLRGPEHVFELANERYYQIVGRRDIIGRTVRDALPEVEGQGFFELLDNVYRTGETFAGNELPAVLQREEGRPPDRRFMNLVYQALREPDGSVSGIFVHGVDVTEHVHARDALRESAERLRLIMSSVKDHAIFTLDLDGRVTTWNGGAERIFGYTAAEMIGRPGSLLFTPEDRADQRPQVEMQVSAGDGGGGVADDTRYHVRKDGSHFFASGSMEGLRDEAGHLRGFVKVVRDITDRRQAEQERERLHERERAARAEAERAGRMKDEFLATLSHELRTPLNAILGWSTIIRGNANDPEDVVQGMEVIERNARAQSQIIEDLLDMSRIISGKVRLDVQRVDLSAIVQASVATVRPTAEAKGVRLMSVIDPLHDVVVTGDANRLQQVFWNLLTNAIKFTPKGGRVQMLLERVNSHLEVSVIDTGEGIRPEFLPYVFDRFRQADASTTRRHGGLGLGLSIVKQLVELHGGSVRVKSAGLGHGTTFVVALPLTVVHPEPEPEPERRHPTSAATMKGLTDACVEVRGVRVLVVDDEPDARALVKRLLEDCRAVVTATDSVDEVLRLVETHRFDVLVSDIGMPGTDGYTLIRQVRALGKDKGGDIPAIALTAYARVEDRVRAVSAGFQMHVAKPVEAVELVAMVAGAAGRAGRT